MRSAVFVLGVLGSISAAGLGTSWWANREEAEYQIEEFRKKAFEADLVRTEEIQDTWREIQRTLNSLYFLFGAAALGLLGAVLAYAGYGFGGGALLLVCGIGPGLLDARAFLGSGLFIFAGGLALFVRPDARSSKKMKRPRDEDEDEDEEHRPRPKRRRSQ